MALHQALWLGLMVPDSNISFKWFLTSSTSGGGICLNHSLKGVSSVTFMICSVEWVQPNSAGSSKNMLWYSARSQWAASANSGVQESRLLKSKSSNNLPCLCLTVSLGVWKLGDSLVPSSNPLDSGVWVLAMQLLPWPLEFSSRGFVGKRYYSIPLQLLFYCLFLTWYMCSVWSGWEARCHPESVGPYHNNNMFSQISLPCLYWYYMRREF